MRSYGPLAAESDPSPPPLRSEISAAVEIETTDAVRCFGTLRWFVEGLSAPLLNRIRRGEGGLLAVNAVLSWKFHSAHDALALTTLSLVCLTSLYLFNDVIDARQDQRNPKKDAALAGLYIRERSAFLAAWLAITLFSVTAGAWIGLQAAQGVAAVSALNVAYSLVGKKIPVFDIVCAATWGAAFSSVVTGSPAWLAMIGAMVAVSHVYQVSEDRHADTVNGIATSATLSSRSLVLLQTTVTAVLAAAAWSLAPGMAAATFAAFVLYWVMWSARPLIGWSVSRAHFALVLIYILTTA